MTTLASIDWDAARLRMRPARARHRVSTHETEALDGAWQFVGLEPDSAHTPADLPRVLGASGRSTISFPTISSASRARAARTRS